MTIGTRNTERPHFKAVRRLAQVAVTDNFADTPYLSNTPGNDSALHTGRIYYYTQSLGAAAVATGMFHDVHRCSLSDQTAASYSSNPYYDYRRLLSRSSRQGTHTFACCTGHAILQPHYLNKIQVCSKTNHEHFNQFIFT